MAKRIPRKKQTKPSRRSSSSVPKILGAIAAVLIAIAQLAQMILGANP